MSRPAHQHAHAFVDFADAVRVRNLAVVEHELARVRAAHAELVELLRGRETLHAFFDDEGGHAARAGRSVRGAHVDQQHVGIRAVRDPHLRAVGDPAIAFLLGAAGHRADDVGAGAGLAHRERADPFAAAELGQVFLLLRFVRVVGDVLHAEVRMRAVRKADRARAARDFLHRDDVREIAELRAAVLARHRDAEQAHLAELLPQVGRERVLAIDQIGARRDFLVGERAHAFAQEVDVFAEREWTHVTATGSKVSGISRRRIRRKRIQMACFVRKSKHQWIPDFVGLTCGITARACVPGTAAHDCPCAAA